MWGGQILTSEAPLYTISDVDAASAYNAERDSRVGRHCLITREGSQPAMRRATFSSPTRAPSDRILALTALYPLSACVASSRHLAKMSTLACSKDLKISSQLDFF